MSKDLKYSSTEMFTLVISNVEYLLEKEKRFLQDNEIKVKNLQSHIELSKKKIGLILKMGLTIYGLKIHIMKS